MKLFLCQMQLLYNEVRLYSFCGSSDVFMVA